MKKTQKKVLGLLGLVLVAVMTICAAFLPGSGASAVETATVTDTIQVRVLDEIPSVTITNPKSDGLTSSLNESITVDYVNLEKFTMTVWYVDEDGEKYEAESIIVETPDETGEKPFPFRGIGETYGYGKYIVQIEGTGLDNSKVQDTVHFEYVAVTADAEVDENTGSANVDLNYNTDDTGLEGDEVVAKIVIQVYDENGNLTEIPAITVTPPTKHVEIPFEEYGLPSGNYKIVITPYNVRGAELYRAIILDVRYDEMLVPDTGGLFKGLNISQMDYLVTGVGVFLIVGIGGIVFINKRSKSTNKRRK